MQFAHLPRPFQYHGRTVATPRPITPVSDHKCRSAGWVGILLQQGLSNLKEQVQNVGKKDSYGRAPFISERHLRLCFLLDRHWCTPEYEK